MIGRSQFANQMKMPSVLRMKHTVPSDDLGNPTTEQLYHMYNDASSIPIVRQQAAALIIQLNALPTDAINMANAGLIPPGQHDRAQSQASTSTSPAEDINPGFQGTSGRTASGQPQKVPRDDNWVPTMARGVPMAMSDAPAHRGREPRHADESRSEPAPPAGAMGVAKNTTPQPKARQRPAADFSHDDDTSLRPSGGGKATGKGKSDKGKGKSDKGKGKSDHPGPKEVSAPAALRPCVADRSTNAATRGVIMRWIRLILPDPLDETILSVVRTNLMVKLCVGTTSAASSASPLPLLKLRRPTGVQWLWNFPRVSLSFH